MTIPCLKFWALEYTTNQKTSIYKDIKDSFDTKYKTLKKSKTYIICNKLPLNGSQKPVAGMQHVVPVRLQTQLAKGSIIFPSSPPIFCLMSPKQFGTLCLRRENSPTIYSEPVHFPSSALISNFSTLRTQSRNSSSWLIKSHCFYNKSFVQHTKLFHFGCRSKIMWLARVNDYSPSYSRSVSDSFIYGFLIIIIILIISEQN